MHIKLSEVVGEIVFDIIFIALSVLFLAFGSIVKVHDQAPVAEYQLLTQRLIEATNYVIHRACSPRSYN